MTAVFHGHRDSKIWSGRVRERVLDQGPMQSMSLPNDRMQPTALCATAGAERWAIATGVEGGDS